MSAPDLTSEVALATDSDLAAIVADYANAAELPPADWLTRLELALQRTFAEFRRVV